MSVNGADAPGLWRRPPQEAPRRDQQPQQQRPPPPAPRRASPPRPSLLLGGVPQCELELAMLQQAYKELLEKEEEGHRKEEASSSSSSSSSSEWSRLVSRFRWLRETLVSCGAGLATPLGLAAAASGADTALQARDWGEFLKSISYLASDGVVGAAAEEEAATSSSSSPSSSASASTFASSSLYAPHEADALLLLYFSCVPPQPQSLDVATRLRALAMRRRRRHAGEEDEKGDGKDGEDEKTPPSSSPSHPLPLPIELSVAVHVAMAAGDGLALARLFRSHPARSWRTRALMAPALERSLWSAASSASASSASASSASASASAPPPPPPPSSPPLPVRGGYPAALAALAASYRSLPVAVARRLMGIGGSSERGEEEGAGAEAGEKLLGELVAVARSRGDKWALAAAAEELPPAGQLKFK